MTRQRRYLTVGLAVALVAGGGLLWWLTRPTALDRIRAHLDATDPGWRFADIHAARLADQPPPGENVVFTAVAAAKLVPRAFTDWQVAAAEADTWPRRPTNRLPADPDGVAAWKASAEAIAAARRCGHQPRGMPDPVIAADPFMTLIPHVQDCRQAAELLRVDAVRSLAAGDPAGALASLRAIQRIARGVGREPFLVSHLAATAVHGVAASATVRCLAVGELPADGLTAVEADLRSAADPAEWASALRDWRATTDLVLTAVADGQADLRAAVAMTGNRSRPGPNLAGRLGYRLSAVGVDHAAALADRTALLGVARRPPHEWTAAVEGVPLPPDDDRHLFSHPEGVEARRQFAGRLRRMAEVRAAATAVAVERFRLASGRWPESLAEVPGDHTDPHTGRPLRLKRLEDGLLVYSVGPDGTDDGGNLSDVSSPPPGTDVGWRLWDTAARKSAAP